MPSNQFRRPSPGAVERIQRHWLSGDAMRRALWSLALTVYSWHRLAQLNKAKAKQGGSNDPGG